MAELSSLRPQIQPPPAQSRPSARAPVQRFSVEALKGGPTVESQRPGPVGQPANDQVDSRGRYRGRRAEAALSQSPEPAQADLAKLKKINQAAVDYESFFVQKMVEAMRTSPMAQVPGGGGYRDLAEKTMAEHLAKAGGLGLAEKITTQVARQEGLDPLLNQHPEVLGPGRKIRLPASHMAKPLIRSGTEDSEKLRGQPGAGPNRALGLETARWALEQPGAGIWKSFK